MARASSGAHQSWETIPTVTLHGNLKVYWGVGDATGGENLKHAVAHGFLARSELDTYSDYTGEQKESVSRFLVKNNRNPWDKPPFFERAIRRNIATTEANEILVHDIEFSFENNAAKAWADRTVVTASGEATFPAFREAYFREWASWYRLPLQWSKERHTGTKVGLYGRQAFHTDYWGIVGKTPEEIREAHQTDEYIWKYIDPYVDFYVSDIYVRYRTSASVFFMAVNVEENYIRTRSFGDKPLFAYEWLRFHDGNRTIPRGWELDDYFVEAMAILPFFSGAKGIVLWGYEPHLKPGDGQPYKQLPLFMQSLERVALLSAKIGESKLVIDKPAHVIWNEKRPLIRRLVVRGDECIVMAINPWQDNTDNLSSDVQCGGHSYSITMRGRHVTLLHIEDGKTKEY